MSSLNMWAGRSDINELSTEISTSPLWNRILVLLVRSKMGTFSSILVECYTTLLLAENEETTPKTSSKVCPKLLCLNSNYLGCHGVGGKLDNRTHKKSDGKLDGRTLTLGPASTNLSHIVRKHAGSTSQIHGLSKPKNGNVRVRIKFGGTPVARSYKNDVYGAAARRHLEENRSEIEQELANITDHKQRQSIIAAHFLKEGRTGTK